MGLAVRKIPPTLTYFIFYEIDGGMKESTTTTTAGAIRTTTAAEATIVMEGSNNDKKTVAIATATENENKINVRGCRGVFSYSKPQCSMLLNNKIYTFKKVRSIEEGLDFILSHFQGEQRLWPRKISTYATEGKQIKVRSREEALARFQQANLIDCRINAYPVYLEWEGINRQAPNVLFAADLDISKFKTEKALTLAANRTLRNIEEILLLPGGHYPTVLWTGNGLHMYQPVQSIVLEEESVFSKFEQPSNRFLRFAERHLSSGKSDPSHSNSVSFKSCLLRVPGSHNSKCIKRNNNIIDPETTGVKIVQEWNGVRPKINPLLKKYHLSLAADKIREDLKSIKREEKRQRHQRLSKIKSRKVVVGDYSYSDNTTMATTTTAWIECLLQIGIEDFRKNVVSLILAPYLLHKKKLSTEQAAQVIQDWLQNKCSPLSRLNFNTEYLIRSALNNASKKPQIYHMSFDTLAEYNPELHKRLQQHMLHR